MKEGWKITELGEVCKYEKHQTKNVTLPYIGLEDIQSGTGKLIGPLTARIVKSTTFKFSKEHVLYGRLRPYLNKVLLPDFDGHCSTEIFPMKPLEGRLDRAFLYKWLISEPTMNMINATWSGAILPRADMNAILKFKINLPPFSEQQRIVSILDEVFAVLAKAKANAEQNLKNAKELFDSYLQSEFEHKEKNWKQKTLGDVCTLYQGLAINAKTKHALVEKSDLPLLRIKDLKNNTVEQYIDPNNFPKNALVSEDDIIYTRTGSLGLVFRGKKGVLHNNSFKVVPSSELDRNFLFIWLQNPIFKSKIMELALKAAQPDITHAIFKAQEIAVPPIDVQENIVKKLNTLLVETKKLETIYQQKINDLIELQQSILQKVFRGELVTEELAV